MGAFHLKSRIAGRGRIPPKVVWGPRRVNRGGDGPRGRASPRSGLTRSARQPQLAAGVAVQTYAHAASGFHRRYWRGQIRSWNESAAPFGNTLASCEDSPAE